MLPVGGAEIVGRCEMVVGCLDLPREFDLETVEEFAML